MKRVSFFYFNQASQAGHILRSIETEDNVIPSANAVLCMNLLQLGVAFEHTHYTQLAHHMIEVMQSNLDYPSAYSHWLLAMLYTTSPSELAIVGTDALEASLQVRANLISKTFVFPVNQSSSIPYFSKYTVNQTTQYYLCENKTLLHPYDGIKQHPKAIDYGKTGSPLGIQY